MVDEFLFAAMLMYMLAEIACDCIGPIGGAAEAMTIIGRKPMDAALVDASLNRATDVAAALTARAIPFGVVHDGGGVAAALANVPLLRKPYDLVDVRRVVKDLLVKPLT